MYLPFSRRPPISSGNTPAVIPLSLLLLWGLASASPARSAAPPEGRSPAGNGNAATLAVETPLGYPWGIAFGRDGQLLFSDAQRRRVYRLDDEGMLDVAAGSGVVGRSTGEPHALDARFNGPTALALGPDSLLYIADTGNHEVLRVEADGRVTVVAGVGPGEKGEGGFSGDGGPAPAARLNSPHGLDFDAAGNLYIADTGNHRVRKVTRPGSEGVISTVAGDGRKGTGGDGKPAVDARIDSPMDVAAGPDGRLLIADRYGARVREVSTDGTIRTVAGGGRLPLADGIPATEAALGRPTAVLYDRDGSPLFADNRHRGIYRVRDGKIVVAVRARPAPPPAPAASPNAPAPLLPDAEPPPALSGPVDLALHPRGGYVVADWSGHRIFRLGERGFLQVLAGNGEDTSQPVAEAPRKEPPPYSLRSVALAPDGSILFSDAEKDELFRLDRDGRLTELNVANGNGTNDAASMEKAYNGGLYDPAGIVALPDGGILFSEMRGHRVRRRSPDGKTVTVAGVGAPGFTGNSRPAPQSRLWSPAGLARDANGALYIADSMNHRIRRIGADGIMTTIAGGSQNPTSNPTADDRRGAASLDPPPPAASPIRLKTPMAVTLDRDGRPVIADTGNGLILRVRTDGSAETLAGGGTEIPVAGLRADQAQLLEPVALAYAPNGDLAIADARDHRVWVVRPDGILRSVLGAERSGTGEGEPAPSLLNRPTGVAYDAQGNLVIVCKDAVLLASPEGRMTTLADRSTPGWGEPEAAEPDTATTSERLKNALQRFKEARRKPMLRWTATPRVTLLGAREVMIAWESEMPAWAVVEYGEGNRLNREVNLTTLSTRPTVSLTNLEPDTAYTFRVRVYRSVDAFRDEIVSRPVTFTTRKAGETPIPIFPAEDPDALKREE